MSNRIQLVLMMSVYRMFLVVCVMVSPTYSDCDPARSLAVDDRQFTA